MRKYFLLVIIIAASSVIYSQSSKLSEMGTRGMEMVYNMKYNEANALFDEIIKLEPKNAYGYFLKSVCYFWMYQNYPQDENLKEKYKNITFEAVEVAEEMLDKNENDLNAMFYLGGAYGNLGRYYVMDRSFAKAYWYGKKGKNYLLDVLQRNPKYYDAYLGLGTYHYYADVLPNVIKAFSFLFGIQGDKELGIKELRLAISNSQNTKTESMIILGAIYTDMEKNYKKALPIFKELFEKYQDSKLAGMALARCYWETDNYEMAKKQYRLMSNKIKGDKKYGAMYNSYGYMLLQKGFKDEAVEVFKKQVELFPNEANSYDSLGDAYKETGKLDLAREQYRKALKLDPNFKASKDKLQELSRKN